MSIKIITSMCAINVLIITVASLNYEGYLKRISLRDMALDDIRYRV